MSFRPKRQHVILEVKLPRTEEFSQRLDESGLEILAYSRWGQYRMQISEADLPAQEQLLRDLAAAARDNYDS
jgi:hypothetical protein